MLSKRSPAVIPIAFSLAVFTVGCEKPIPPPPSPAPPAAAARIVSFRVEPPSIQPGQPATLQWEVAGAASVSIDNAIGTVPAVGSRRVFPAGSRTYTLTASGPGGSVTASATIEVFQAVPPPPPPPPPPSPAPPQAAPVFPWPPPRWTLKYPIPDSLVVRSGDKPSTMNEALGRIKGALAQAGIDQWSVYSIPDSGGGHGFAVVSRPENIGDDGRWKTPRFCIEDCKLEAISLGSVMRALFSANASRYRVIALVVTDLPIQPGTASATPAEMEQIVTQGPSTLPPAMAAKPVTPYMICQALIYEFYRPNPGAATQLVDPSSFTAIEHLTGAGLWKKEDLQQ